jgi:hypothetical protein
MVKILAVALLVSTPRGTGSPPSCDISVAAAFAIRRACSSGGAFDVLAWLQTGDMVPAGELTTTEITAEAA